MIAQVRPLRRESDVGPLRHLWGVVLRLSRDHERCQRPIERATCLIPSARLVAVFTREADGGTPIAASDVAGVHRCVQPSFRGTAPEMFLATLPILQRDPDAIVAALPADHLGQRSTDLMPAIARAAAAVARRPELPVIIAGLRATGDPDSAWVEPGRPMEGLHAFGVRAVRRVVTLPSPAERVGGLLGTVAFVIGARTLVNLGRRLLPDIVECLEPLEAVVGRPEAALLCDAVWESMPRARVCRDLLARAEPLGVVAMPDAMTGEWAPVAAHALAS